MQSGFSRPVARSVSTAWEFEQNVSLMLMEYQHPAYSELLLQTGFPVAFRHPEYMLARDLEFLYEVYLDTESEYSLPKDYQANCAGSVCRSFSKSDAGLETQEACRDYAAEDNSGRSSHAQRDSLLPVVVVVVTIAVAIPVVVVLDNAVFTFPAALEKAFSVVTGAHPTCTAIRWPRPITCMPYVATIHGIPISINPYIVRSRAYGSDSNNSGRGWRPDSDTNRYLSEYTCADEYRCGQQLTFHLLSSER
jgi:hypothetical protein